MEIIKRGTPPGEKIYEATCIICKTEVRFKQSEGKISIGRSGKQYITVLCPVCGNIIDSTLR